MTRVVEFTVRADGEVLEASYTQPHGLAGVPVCVTFRFYEPLSSKDHALDRVAEVARERLARCLRRSHTDPDTWSIDMARLRSAYPLILGDLDWLKGVAEVSPEYETATTVVSDSPLTSLRFKIMAGLSACGTAG